MSGLQKTAIAALSIDAGAAATGAAFIASFVKEEQPRAPLDIASVDWLSERPSVMLKGASGFGVRLLYGVALSELR